MRLLFVNSHSADYLEDQLFSGLTELLGADNVIPYPVNWNYYLPRRPYPRDLGRCRTPLAYLGDRLRLGRRLRDMDFDAVVIGSTKRDTFENYLALVEQLPRALPLVYIDGGDWPEVGGDARRMGFAELYAQVMATRQPAVVFKREYLEGMQYAPNVFALPMAYGPAPAIQLQLPAKYDVTCWCVESHESRTRALGLLEDRYDCRANGTVRGQKFRSYSRKGTTYLRELAASRIACNFRGVGWDTLRYWEIPALGVLMVSAKPQIRIEHNFIHGEHALFCRDDLSDLVSLLDHYLSHPDEREAIAAAGQAQALRYHTYRHRAEQFLAVLADHGIGS